MVVIGAREAGHRTRQMREVPDISALLELQAADARREAHDLRPVRIADGTDRRIQALHDMLEGRRSVRTARRRPSEISRPWASSSSRKALVGSGDGLRHAGSSGSSRERQRQVGIVSDDAVVAHHDDGRMRIAQMTV